MTLNEKRLAIALLTEKLQNLSGKKVIFEEKQKIEESLKDWLMAGLITFSSVAGVSNVSKGASAEKIGSNVSASTSPANRALVKEYTDKMNDEDIMALYTQLEQKGVKHAIQLKQEDAIALTKNGNLNKYLAQMMKKFMLENSNLFRLEGNKLVVK
jgi:hypothetical protein